MNRIPYFIPPLHYSTCRAACACQSARSVQTSLSGQAEAPGAANTNHESLALCSCEWFVLLSCACPCDLLIFCGLLIFWHESHDFLSCVCVGSVVLSVCVCDLLIILHDYYSCWRTCDGCVHDGLDGPSASKRRISATHTHIRVRVLGLSNPNPNPNPIHAHR